MQTQVHEEWLADTRAFWDVESSFDARYRRICSDPEIDGCQDEARLQELWDRRTESELPQLLKGVPIEPDWTCLEIGCGIGRLMKPIAQRCRRLIGVDISPKMIEHAHDYLADVPNVELHLNDGRTLDGVADNSVDWVYSHLAFQHLTSYDIVESYIAEIARVLKPGGYCRIQCWQEAPLSLIERIKNVARRVLGGERYHGPRRWLWSPGREVRFGGVTFHPRPWRRLLKRRGLGVVSTELGLGHDYWMWTTSRKV